MFDPLRHLLERVEFKEPVFSGDEVLRWPHGTRDLLIAAGLLRPVENAVAVECDACGEGHVEDVQYLSSSPGTPARAYIPCPEAGRARIDAERLRQWDVDLQRLASSLAVAVSARGRMEELIPDRLWNLGRVELHRRERDVFLARGLFWADGAQVIGASPVFKRSSASVVLVSGPVPSRVGQADGTSAIVPIANLVSLREGRILLERRCIEDALLDASHPSAVAPPQGVADEAYCRILTREARGPRSKKDYESVRKARARYDMFIDVFDSKAWSRRGKGRHRSATLTPKELSILADYIVAQMPMRPTSTTTGKTCLSPESACRLFETARAKADVKLGRYKYRAFRLHRNPADRKMNEYEFAPPDDLAYCVVLRA